MKERIEIEVYNLYLDVYLAKDDDEADRIHRKLMGKFGHKTKEIHDASATCYSQYIDKKGYRIQPVLFKMSVVPYVGLCAHEALHCVFNIMKLVDIEYCSKSEEAFTHLQGTITQNIWDAIKRMKKKIK